MSSTQWDKMGSINKNTYPQNIPGAINNRIPFMLAKDAASKVPANAGDWNDNVEELRVKGLDILGTVLSPVATAFSKIDSATDGGFSKLLSAGYKNLRSNYAFTRDVAEKNAALGLLSGAFTVTGAVAGGIIGFGLGGPIGAAAGASLGGSLYGTLQREAAQTDYVKKTANFLYRASKFAETDAGQESYNFGRDVVRFTSDVTGWTTLGDTTKGVGAITSGLLNFGFELTASPDIGLAKGVGAVGRRALVAPIDEVGTGIVSRRLSAKDAIESAKRHEADIDKIKRTAAGEVTEYTPVFQFYRENSPAVVAQRAEFRGDIPQIAANLVAGESDEVISLVLRIGRYDDTAIKELDNLMASKVAEYNRVSDSLKVVEDGGMLYVSYKGELITANGLAPDATSYLKKELDSLQKEVQWLNDARVLTGSMTERTVAKGKWNWVERVRNDLAKERAARKFELSKANVFKGARVADDLGRETRLGGVIQTVYQKSPFSVLIRSFDRATDDAPRGTINFSDRLLAADRFRANIRGAVRYGALNPEDGMKFYNDFISASDEVTKYNLVKEYTDKLGEGLGEKYGLSSLMVKEILQTYDRKHKTVLNEARTARDLGRAYMIAEDGKTVINDPQLISQLANGAYLPDPKLWEKAFKEFSKKYGEEASFPIKRGIEAKYAIDEFQTLWRGFTLLRAGYPVNIIRDSAIRMLGDGALFPALKILTTDMLHSITNYSNTGSKLRSAIGPVDPAKNLNNIRDAIGVRDTYIYKLEQKLNEAGIDLTAPLNEVPLEFQGHVRNLNGLKATVAALREQEKAIVAKTPPVKRVSRDSIIVEGYEFPAAGAGRFGDISMQQLRMQDDLRRALTSLREVETGTLRRSRTGGRSITPLENEQQHLVSWVQILKDRLGNDVVARKIMEGKSKSDIIKFIRNDPEGQNYLSRFGLAPSEAGIVYSRVVNVIKQFAPNSQLFPKILDNTISIDDLRRIYPDVNERPVVTTDLVDDMTATSTAYQRGKDLLQDSVAWLATAPTTKLMYAPYFAFKYQHKLQKLIHLANIQGKQLTLKDKQQFERVARSYAISEYRSKLNSFHRDMNYSGLMNYAIAFFPAIVEQYRAYGRITLEHPDFLLKAYAIRTLPERAFEVQVDPVSEQEYFEVELPILGLTARVPVDWFNPFNPTGSTLIGASPIVAASWNEYVKRVGGEEAVQSKLTKWILPFGVQANSTNALLPNTVRRIAQAAYGLIGGGEGPSQFNKDTNMFLRQAMADYIDQNHKNPSDLELGRMVKQSEERALLMGWLRVGSAFTSPAQPRYVTALQPYIDELAKMRAADPINGEEDFVYMNPDLFFLTDSLSNSLSGIRSDDTAVSLVKRNPDMLKDLVAIAKDDLSILGAIFNDDNYVFSSAAQAYLESSKIPYVNKAFKEYGAPLEEMRNAVVNKGWREWTAYMDSVRQEVRDGDPSYNPNRGYGANIVEYYRDLYLESQKTKNPLWYEEYIGGGGYGNTRQHRLVKALTYALNDNKMWKDLSQNPRWYAVIQYLNFRYDVNEELNRLGTTFDSNAAISIRGDVNEFVDILKRQSPDFGLFYERYFANDKFDYIPEEQK